MEGSTKTHQARDVPIPPSLSADLDPVLSGKAPDDLVFAAPTGGPLRSTNFRSRVWNPAVKKAGLDGLTIHGLRHTAASLYISAGTPPKVVQRILGHASIAITMDLYGHLYADEMDTWAERLDQVARAMDVRPECGQSGADEGDNGPAPDGASL